MPAHTVCVACEEAASGRHGIPVDDTGRIVHNGYTGVWTGAPACEGCFLVHKAGGPDVLDAHIKATRDLRKRLTKYRNAAREFEKATDNFFKVLSP